MKQPPRFHQLLNRASLFVVLALSMIVVSCGAPAQPKPTVPPTSPPPATRVTQATAAATSAPPASAAPLATATTAATAAPTATRIPPTATSVPPPQLIAYTRWATTGKSGIRVYVMKPDGSAQTEIAEGASPAWSPDGQRIAFACYATGNGICVVNANGADLKALTKVQDDGAPVWSPDGTRVAFVSKKDGNEEIYVIKADGSQLTRLTNNKAGDTDPAWSPDGQQIAFVSDRDGVKQVYLMNADGSQQTNLTNNQATMTSNGHPAWSPDGKQIAFHGVSKSSFWEQVYVMNRDGSGQKALTKDGSNNSRPAWSPDGRRIAFDSTRDVADAGKRMLNPWSQVYVMSADGSGQTRLTNEPEVHCSEAAWPAGAVDQVAAQPTSAAATKAPSAPTAPPGNAGPSASSGTGSTAEPATLVMDALKLQSTKAYRGTISAGQDQAIYEYVPPDRYHISGGGTEYILLGDAGTFMKNKDQWSKMDKEWGNLALMVVWIGGGYADKITEASVAPETLNGKPMSLVTYKGQLKVEGASEPYTTPVQYKMWIGAGGLPYQVTFEQGGQLGTTTIQYDSTIQITAPSVP